MDALLYTLTDVSAATGLNGPRIEYLCDVGICVPARESTGRGSPHGFNDENILELNQGDDLMRGGFSSRQTAALMALQRDAIKHLPPDERLVRRYEYFIATVIALADWFGRKPGYDEWVRTQREQLAKMKAELKKPPRTTSTGRARRRRSLLHLFVAGAKAQRQAAASLPTSRPV